MQLINILPRRFSRVLADFSNKIEEIRMSAGQDIIVHTNEEEISPLKNHPISRDELWRIVEAAAGGTLFSCESQLKKGFLSLEGGVRVGVCGSVNTERGEIRSFSDISSICIRFPHQAIGCAENLGLSFVENFKSTLIIAPPGGGKTTLLRELIRLLSNGGYRVGLSDERSEIAAMHCGVPQLDVGCRTDVFDGAPKAIAVMTLLKCMTPNIVALDEITEEDDLRALINCHGCGVKLLATAHGAGIVDLQQRKLYTRLLDEKIFERCVIIKKTNGNRRYEVKNFD